MKTRKDAKWLKESLNNDITKWYHIPPELRVVLLKTVQDWIDKNPDQELPSSKSFRSNIIAEDYKFNNLDKIS